MRALRLMNRMKQMINIKKEEERLYALTRIEREFWSKPGVVLAGMDEVGRGPLAGPVVAACVVLPPEPLVQFVNDSKKLSGKLRKEVCGSILKQAGGYALGWVEADAIDKSGILHATREAFCLACTRINLPITDLLIDALRDLPVPMRQHSFIRGDAQSYLIGAASIVAKVLRDEYMEEQHELYPKYGFARNKGYGTAEHIKALKEYGPCPLHRYSFIKGILEVDYGA